MQILFVDILTDDAKLRRNIERSTYQGTTYGDRCRRAFGLTKHQWTIVDASRGVFPNLQRFDAVVIGGSVENPVNPKEDKPWMKKTFAFIRQVIKADLPLLGICGGLQFTARALGASVVINPTGRRIGTPKVTLTTEGKRDPLFAGLPRQFRIAATHRCIVKKALAGWKVLASDATSPCDALAIGERIRLIQFHPEMTCAVIKSIVRQRKNQLIDEGINKPTICLYDRAGKKILRNFLGLVEKTKKPTRGLRSVVRPARLERAAFRSAT